MSGGPPRAAPPPPPEDDHDERGASAKERLLAAAKTDNEEMLETAMQELDDINCVDGMGNTALHYAIIHASTSLIDPILCHDTCDVDIRNRHDGDTPLHIAVRQRWEEHTGLRLFLVESLLEAGADTKIRNRRNLRPIDFLPPADLQNPESDEEKVRASIRRAEAESLVADKGDVVDEDESDGEIDPDDIASD